MWNWAKVGESAEDDRGLSAGTGGLDAQRSAEHAADAADQFTLCALHYGRDR